MLEKYIDEKGLDAPIYTYGFGNNLDSELLNDLAIMGNGRYNFIPDCSFVGTIFVNSCSNILATCGKNLTIKFENAPGFKIDDEVVLGNYKHNITSWGVEVKIGSIQYGQTKTMVLKYPKS